MADAFIEIEEAMKQERLEKLWKNYGNYLIIFILLTIIGTGAFSGYKSWNESVYKEQTTKLMAAQQQEDPAQALAELAPSLRPGLSTVAQLQAAGEMLESGIIDKASDIYSNIANNKKAPVEYRELAEFTLARLQSPKNPDKALALLEPLINGSGAWRHHARLEAAIVLAHKKLDYEGARNQLAALLTADAVPKSLSQKANSLDMLYALKQQEQDSPEEKAHAIQPAAAAK